MSQVQPKEQRQGQAGQGKGHGKVPSRREGKAEALEAAAAAARLAFELGGGGSNESVAAESCGHLAGRPDRVRTEHDGSDRGRGEVPRHRLRSSEARGQVGWHGQEGPACREAVPTMCQPEGRSSEEGAEVTAESSGNDISAKEANALIIAARNAYRKKYLAELRRDAAQDDLAFPSDQGSQAGGRTAPSLAIFEFGLVGRLARCAKHVLMVFSMVAKRKSLIKSVL